LFTNASMRSKRSTAAPTMLRFAASTSSGGACQPTVGVKVFRYFAGVMPTNVLNSLVKWL
jgi:hypothetical protein